MYRSKYRVTYGIWWHRIRQNQIKSNFIRQQVTECSIHDTWHVQLHVSRIQYLRNGAESTNQKFKTDLVNEQDITTASKIYVAQRRSYL